MFGNIEQQLTDKYVGTEWKWVANNNKTTIGATSKISSILNIDGTFFAKFENGERLNVEILQDFVSPLTPGISLPPKSITPPKSTTPKTKSRPQSVDERNRPIDMMGESKKLEDVDDIEYPSMRKVTAHGKVPQVPNLPPSPESILGNLKQNQPSINTQTTVSDSNLESDLFKMFDAQERDINLKVKIRIPELKLLKLMLQNAQNSEEFLSKLSKYVLSKVKDEHIIEAMSKMLGYEKPPKKQARRTSKKTTTKPEKQIKTNDKGTV